MQVFLVVVVIALVNGLLLSAVAKFLDTQVKLQRILLGSAVGAVLAVLCLLPEAGFARAFLWRIVILVSGGLTAYGFQRRTCTALLLFILLHLSLGGLSSDGGSLISMLLGALGISLACYLVGRRELLTPVELSWEGKCVKVTALRDTGNTLLDPVTGNSVLVIDARIANTLTGLTPKQLEDPVKTMEAVPGLRLIPYRTVGGSGFLLARCIPQVKIGTWQGSTLVAFSPQEFGRKYQALTGGRV